MNKRFDFRTKRLFVTERIRASVPLQLSSKQAHYLFNVLRLKSEDSILAFNGQDGEWRTDIIQKARKQCELIPKLQTRAQPEPYKLLYCFAPLKQARLDYMIQKAVEMGVGILQPVITDYTQVRTLNRDRIHANMIEAAEQCSILAIPELRNPQALKNLVHNWAVTDKDRILVFCDELADGENYRPMHLQKLQSQSIGILIGPEGGFSQSERQLLRDQNFVKGLSLGPRILRADTAAVVALTLVQDFAGDLQ